MGTDEKVENKVESLGGRLKEAAGKVTNDRELETEGKADQGRADLKDAAEKVKDAFKN